MSGPFYGNIPSKDNNLTPLSITITIEIPFEEELKLVKKINNYYQPFIGSYKYDYGMYEDKKHGKTYFRADGWRGWGFIDLYRDCINIAADMACR